MKWLWYNGGIKKEYIRMIECELLKVNTKIVALALVAMAVVGGFGVELAYAESASANASVTVANTISLTLTGGDLVIDNLTPGNASDSNVITASVTSNSPYGFHLSATTGTSGGTTSLVNTADSNFTFTNLNSNKASLSNFSDNTWGYSYSADGTNWISGDYGAGATAGYNGLPLDGNDDGDSGVVLFNSDSYFGSKSVQFKIGAKSATTQAAGTYTNAVNFYAVVNPKPATTIANANTMQEVDSGIIGCPSTLTTNQVYTLKDSRDNIEYHVAKLADGKCWMLDNLALDITNSKTLSGLSDANTNIDIANDPDALNALKGIVVRDPNIDAGGKYATAGVGVLASGDKYSVPLVDLNEKDIVPTDTISYNGRYKVGGYYNFCAASAGSYCYGNDTLSGTSLGNATSDICPRGWRIPIGGLDGEYSSLANAIYGSKSSTSSVTDYTNYRIALHLPLSGYYSGGSISERNSYGYWWSSTRIYDYSMKRMFVESSTTSIFPNNNNGYREYGYPIRCVLDS